MIFRNIDYDDFTRNDDLLDIYLWNPSSIGKTSKSKISKKGEISNERKRKYTKPTRTARDGLVTSRVGQGYYRQQILEKWEGKCPITGVDIRSILISSHIVPWSESNDKERLDVENGILLSPIFDALFDRNLISFENDGKILISEKLGEENKIRLGLNKEITIKITDGMIPYLEKHRKKYRDKLQTIRNKISN